MVNKKHKSLGQGINALFPDAANLEETIDESSERIVQIDLGDLRPNPYQPRREFNQQALDELSKSIQQQGVLQPIIVRQSSVKGFEIVAGERRYRASKQAGLETIPAIIRELDEKVMMQVAILENLQREDLTALEEADAYQLMMDKLDMTQEKVAKELGKSRSYIANHLRLRTLPAEAKALLQSGDLSMGQARTLLGLKEKKQIPKLAQQAVQDELTVRQLEAIVSEYNQDPAESKEPPTDKQPKQPASRQTLIIRDLEERLTSQLDRTVHIKDHGEKGKIVLDYHSTEDLNHLLAHLGLDINETEAT
ncbi:chromosome partitioning protein ParB [Dolosigranulum pigrum]|uniref:ParB/RepB/Spo0J family partition protein n=1 Tax=Dolosigranulum pigrum TaxID=29394 RepID=UPI000DC03396|nr:ParB/RepB/Spo0J family partition protein [Dolosigranulum pigrum]RAN57107.1 chromosome partitioning protein ParB [Dolosigranulum pigrum]